MARYTFEVTLPTGCTINGETAKVTDVGTLVFEVEAPIGAAPSELKAERVIIPPGAHLPSCWPNHNEAIVVHPDDRGAASKAAAEKGVPTDFDSLGRAIFTDRSHFKKYNRAFGITDRSAYSE